MCRALTCKPIQVLSSLGVAEREKVASLHIKTTHPERGSSHLSGDADLMEHLQVFMALLALATAQNVTHSSHHHPCYLLLAPAVLQEARPTSLSITILISTPVFVSARILHDDLVVASESVTVGGDSTQLLTLPPVNISKSSYQYPYLLEVTGYVDSMQVLSNSTHLYFQQKDLCTTFIKTDKVNYYPGQTVHIRTVSVQADGKACSSLVDIMVKDPRGNLLRQWRSLEAVLGVVSREFRLSEKPPLGQWTICALVDGATVYKHVHILYHETPKFLVLVDVPYAIHHEDMLHGVVTAKYMSGQPVRGYANITMLHLYHGYQDAYDQHTQIDGSADFKFVLPNFHPRSSRSAERTYSESYMEKESLKITVNVTDHVTGVTHQASAKVCVSMQRYKLSFSGYPKVLKPSMSFTAKVQIYKYNYEPLSMEDLQKTLKVSVMQQRAWNMDAVDQLVPRRHSHDYPEQTSSQDMEFPIHEDGVVVLNFLLMNDTQSLTIDASLEDSHKTLQLDTYYQSPSQSYIQIQKYSDSAEVGSPFMLHVDSSFPLTGIHYVVKSRGQIVSAGKSSAHITLVPEPAWAPMVSVIVFLVRPDGEVVNDMVRLYISPYLPNKVSLSWSEPKTRPGNEVTLRVSVEEPGSLVGILVQDKAAHWAGPHYDMTKNMDKDYYDASMETYYPDALRMGDPLSVFMLCHLLVLTDATLHAYHPGLKDQAGEEDYYLFHMDSEYHSGQEWESPESWISPETWIWMETSTGDSRSADITVTVPDSITTWSAMAFVMSQNLGLGITERPAQLTVYKEFCLSLNLPPFIIRGEELLLEVVLYNNLHQDLQLIVVVAQSETFEFIFPDNEMLAMPGVRRVPLAGKSAASVLVPIRPLVLGEIPILVKASSSVASDVFHGKVLVKPEGMEQTFSTSLLLDVPPRRSEMVTFTFPDHVVAGSSRACLTLVGDILGPSISGLDSLIQMPYGCGEQNMINFAPNIYVLQYLNASGQAEQDITDMAVAYMMTGYERELSYQRADGSFSAFGEQDSSGSTWLSAFVLRCFLQARPFISIEDNVLHAAAAWLGNQQGADGAYEEPGRVIHTELQGGLDGPVSLTAYVLIALLEDPHITAQYAPQVSAALMFLETRLVLGVSSNYSLSLLAYALALDGSTNAHVALDELMGRADMTDGVPRWTSPGSGLAESWQPRTADIEMASYVLLGLHKTGRLAEGVGLVKWLGRQRNPGGGFGSTQDTVVALQALSTFAVLLDRDVNLTVSVNGGVFHIHQNNRMLQQKQQVDIQDTLNLALSAEGHGLAFFQLNVFYNVRTEEVMRQPRDAGEHEAFDVHVRLYDKPIDSRAHLDVCCSLWSGRGLNATGMSIMEVGLLSGFSIPPDAVHLDHVIKRVETQAGKVILYLDSVTTENVCVLIPLLVDVKVAQVREALVLVYDYYEPRRRSARTYESRWRQDVTSCSFCGDDCRLCANDQYEVSAAERFRVRPLHALLLLVITLL
ncbi:CD109 antigen [Dunckerocampus dactyliophorus]|uniref:CD109 antigen n=1 Tax=Dunckerocampus dactyliophorus TaxID=161453 RepID=UPI002405F9AB|nr:CD109 antigen [Dunckerocampus dactyliophorus]